MKHPHRPVPDLSIGDLSASSNTKVTTIRYYESIGLMPKPVRSEGNQRRYDQAHLERLAFIRHARELGFPVDAIRELLSLAAHPEKPCARADEIARTQLDDVEGKIKRLNALKRELKRMITECSHGVAGQCRIIETLADHRLCSSTH
jgi:DNA-binding transcriptional MerR regulator